MTEVQRHVDAIRARSTELENHIIDEYRAGNISRRDFVKRGTVVGMSLPIVSFLAACGGGGGNSSGGGGGANTGKVKPGGTIRTGIQSPAVALDPVKVNTEGGLAVLGQSGEYLTWSDRNLNLRPRLAESWKPNKDGSVWTFQLQPGVTFHDGTPMTAADVVATFDRNADPKNAGNALSAFTGVLSKGGTKAKGDSTVVFELDAPNGSFPYLVSSDNYNLIILPKSFSGKWDKTFMGTGPWKLDKYTPDVGVTYTKNTKYWDKTRQPLASRNQIKFYGKEQAALLGLQGNEVDLLSHYSLPGGKALLNDPNFRTIELHSAAHRQVHMRTDKEPFKDKRVRQAVALLIDRQALIKGVFQNKADIGNDSPFAPVFKTTDESVPQRKHDVAKAKQLLQAAGKGGGFTVQLDTWDGFEIPDLAQLIQSNVKEAGIKLKLNITDQASYFGDAVYGKSRWLDSTMGITEYGHRGVPNVFLGAPLKSKGTWNGAHFRNKKYDKLVDEYTAALDPATQRAKAKQIQELLLDETPIIFPYFYYFLTATKPKVAGVDVTAMGHVDLDRAGQTA
jgi:peptide/nickel transport system substrate-binding protein